MNLIKVLPLLTAIIVLSGCGETLITYRYEYEDVTCKLKAVDVNFSMVATFKEDSKDPNNGTFKAPYRLRIALCVPASTKVAKMTIKGLTITGVESKVSLDLEPRSTDKSWSSLNSDNEKQTAVVVAIPSDSSLKYEALNIRGVVHVILNNGETYLESDFEVQLETNYREEKKNKLLSGILGI